MDALVDDLQRLRLEAGDVSYAELAARISRLREGRGMAPAAARVARSSVFDVFRAGRTRINADLVADIVLALGRDDAEAQRWRDRCLRARAVPRRTAAVAPSPALSDRSLQRAFVLVLLVACVGINLFGGAVVSKFGLPLWFDTVGTAIAAIAVGPWHGALVGIATNSLGAFTGETETVPFALVSVVGALVWGYGVRNWGMGRSPLRFLLLNAIVAVACTMTAVPITVLVLGGEPSHASGGLIAVLAASGEGLWLAVFSANILLSLADKQLSGFIALLLARLMERLRSTEPRSTVRSRGGAGRLDTHSSV
jgi:energy-coupling factor transport system substrate-specific component